MDTMVMHRTRLVVGTTIVAIVTAAFLTVSCGVDSRRNDPESGQVVDGIYSNDYFGLELPIPDGWHVTRDDTAQFMQEIGEEVMLGDDAALTAAVEASKKMTIRLLNTTQFEIGAAVDYNPSLILMAERVTHMPGIKSGGDYLFHVTKALLRTQLPYEVVKKSYPVKFGGGLWYRADFTINLPAMTISQTYLCKKRGDFILTMILSGTTPEQTAALEQAASKISLNESR